MTLPVAGAADVSRPRSVLDLVGNTPLLRLRRFERADGRVQLYAKAEWKNPGGSVKDRAAVAMVLDGERQRPADARETILDATSGNTGIAYAMIGAARGYPVKLCMPENVTPERKRILRAYGAELVLTDPMEGSDGAIRRGPSRSIAADPDRYYYPDQYSNPANWQAHYNSDGPRDPGADRWRASRTSSPASAPAARSWAPGASCASTSRRARWSRSSRIRRCTASKA